MKLLGGCPVLPQHVAESSLTLPTDEKEGGRSTRGDADFA